MRRSWKVIMAIQIVIFFLLPILIFLFLQSDSPLEVKNNLEVEDDHRPLLRVADDYNYPPYSYLDEKGNPTGYNVELIRAVADIMGYQLDLQLMPWPDVVLGLKNGEYDLTSGLFNTDERADIYAFSTKHSMTYGDIFSVRGETISSLEELRGKTVVVLRDDIMDEYLSKQDLNLNLKRVDTAKDAFYLLSNNLVEYVGVVKPVGMYVIEEGNFTNLQANGLLLAPQEYCIAANLEQSELIDLVNSGLHILKANGSYDEIYDRWLGIYEPWNLKVFVQKYYLMFILLAALLVFLIEGLLVLRYLVRKKSKELEISYASQFAAESKNKVILEAIPDMIFDLNTQGVILDYSREHPRLKKLAKDGRLIEKIKRMLGKRQIDIIMQMVKRVAETGQMETDRVEVIEEGESSHLEYRMVRLNDNEVMAIVRDITQKYLDEMQIRYLSEHDQMTGLMNRRFFDKTIQALNQSETHPISILMIDVNGLKLINDSFGHFKGDELLKIVAEILRESCLQRGSISRIGGDEFVMILPQTTYEEAKGVANSIQMKCAGRRVASLEISVSVGWATRVSPAQDLNNVLIKAEDFMYKEKLLEAPGMHGEAISAIMHTLYEKNKREEAHSQRVSKLSVELAKAMGLSEKDCQEMKTVGLLHDIGKIAIPENILNKPGRLAKEEYEEIKKHPEIGFRILGSIKSMSGMAESVLSHHERWDGKGYPIGLKGEEIPLLARIIALADSYDAMTSERSYKKEMTKVQATAEIERNLGTQFDPLLGKLFIDHVVSLSQEEVKE